MNIVDGNLSTHAQKSSNFSLELNQDFSISLHSSFQLAPPLFTTYFQCISRTEIPHSKLHKDRSAEIPHILEFDTLIFPDVALFVRPYAVPSFFLDRIWQSPRRQRRRNISRAKCTGARQRHAESANEAEQLQSISSPGNRRVIPLIGTRPSTASHFSFNLTLHSAPFSFSFLAMLANATA